MHCPLNQNKKDPDLMLQDVKVFLYSHTILVGIDIQLKYDIQVFIDCPNDTIDARQKYQLIWRVRNFEELWIVSLG